MLDLNIKFEEWVTVWPITGYFSESSVNKPLCVVKDGDALSAGPAKEWERQVGPRQLVEKLDWPLAKAQLHEAQARQFPGCLGSLAAVGSVCCLHLAPTWPQPSSEDRAGNTLLIPSSLGVQRKPPSPLTEARARLSLPAHTA